MKSDPESIRQFCKWFAYPNQEREAVYVNSVRNYMSIYGLINTLSVCIVRFNDGLPSYGRKNPDNTKYRINIDDAEELAQIYWKSVKRT